MDTGALLTAASIVGAFGTSVLTFRIQREIEVEKSGGPTWIPWADVQMLGATVTSLAVVGVLLVVGSEVSATLRLASAGLAAAAVLAAGYPPAVLAHYRLLPGSSRTGPRTNPEPAELVLVLLSAALALAAAAAAYRNASAPV
jgi:hypothetical protein